MGMVANTKVETVFICEKDDTIMVNCDEEAFCPNCKSPMENAGWFESENEKENTTQKE